MIVCRTETGWYRGAYKLSPLITGGGSFFILCRIISVLLCVAEEKFGQFDERGWGCGI